MALVTTTAKQIIERGVMNSFPKWLQTLVENQEDADWFERSWPENARMQLAVDLSRWNVERGSGGPFGAAIFDTVSGRLVALGVNRVEHGKDPTGHAEVVAIRMACQGLSLFNLNQASPVANYVLYSSAEPCCMCVGAVLWSGIKQVYFAADRTVVEATGFDEGPQMSSLALEQRGVQLTHMRGVDDVFSLSAAEVLNNYHSSGGLIYNGD